MVRHPVIIGSDSLLLWESAASIATSIAASYVEDMRGGALDPFLPLRGWEEC